MMAAPYSPDGVTQHRRALAGGVRDAFLFVRSLADQVKGRDPDVDGMNRIWLVVELNYKRTIGCYRDVHADESGVREDSQALLCQVQGRRKMWYPKVLQD